MSQQQGIQQRKRSDWHETLGPAVVHSWTHPSTAITPTRQSATAQSEQSPFVRFRVAAATPSPRRECEKFGM